MSRAIGPIGGALFDLRPYLGVVSAAFAQVTGDVPAARPDALIDLATREGTAQVSGQWRYSDTKIVEVGTSGGWCRPEGEWFADACLRHRAARGCRRLRR